MNTGKMSRGATPIFAKEKTAKSPVGL
jgi:predicted RNA binding protein YcfA (HicA-like mRNA interferase family)